MHSLENVSKFWGFALIWKKKKAFLSLDWRRDNEILPALPDTEPSLLYFSSTSNHKPPPPSVTQILLQWQKHHHSHLRRGGTGPKGLLVSMFRSVSRKQQKKMQALNLIFNCAMLKHHYLYIPLLPCLYGGNPTYFGSGAAELFWMQAWRYRNDCWAQKAWCFCHKKNTMTNVDGPLL